MRGLREAENVENVGARNPEKRNFFGKCRRLETGCKGTLASTYVLRLRTWNKVSQICRVLWPGVWVIKTQLKTNVVGKELAEDRSRVYGGRVGTWLQRMCCALVD